MGNKMGPWWILEAKFKLTNVHLGVIWYHKLVAGTFDAKGTGEEPGDRRRYSLGIFVLRTNVRLDGTELAP